MPGLIQDLISGAGWKQTLGDVASNMHNANYAQQQGQQPSSPNSGLIDPRNPLARFRRRTPGTPTTPIQGVTTGGGYDSSTGDSTYDVNPPSGGFGGY